VPQKPPGRPLRYPEVLRKAYRFLDANNNRGYSYREVAKGIREPPETVRRALIKGDRILRADWDRTSGKPPYYPSENPRHGVFRFRASWGGWYLDCQEDRIIATRRRPRRATSAETRLAYVMDQGVEAGLRKRRVRWGIGWLARHPGLIPSLNRLFHIDIDPTDVESIVRATPRIAEIVPLRRMRSAARKVGAALQVRDGVLTRDERAEHRFGKHSK